MREKKSIADEEIRRKKLSVISTIHYFKLMFRSMLFLSATVLYILHRLNHSESVFGGLEQQPLLGFIWLAFLLEMVLRFFPSKLESMGCQKQFASNYRGNPEVELRPRFTKDLVLTALLWLLLNAVFGILYFVGVFDKEILILISLAFSVCDMVCILFFCPFQTWIMKNKCCGSCRIYNWDYAMMFTPLVFVKNPYSWSLLLCALLLLARWEITAYFHPERFFEHSNPALSCANCQEKLCHHKKQLQEFLKENRHNFLLPHNSHNPHSK